jgi:hypothetical protein
VLTQVEQIKNIKERYNHLIFKKNMLSKAKGFLKSVDVDDMVR